MDKGPEGLRGAGFQESCIGERKMGRLFCLALLFLLALAPAACIRAYPKTVGALEISARRSDGRTFTTRGPITSADSWDVRVLNRSSST